MLCLLECKNNGICLENSISWSWLSAWKYTKLPALAADLTSR